MLAPLVSAAVLRQGSEDAALADRIDAAVLGLAIRLPDDATRG
nr:hypothetical protein [uncultured Lichenicoccus sp.]